MIDNVECALRDDSYNCYYIYFRYFNQTLQNNKNANSSILFKFIIPNYSGNSVKLIYSN